MSILDQELADTIEAERYRRRRRRLRAVPPSESVAVLRRDRARRLDRARARLALAPVLARSAEKVAVATRLRGAIPDESFGGAREEINAHAERIAAVVLAAWTSGKRAAGRGALTSSSSGAPGDGA